MPPARIRSPKVLAISSRGSCWMQLVAVADAFQNTQIDLVLASNRKDEATEPVSGYKVSEFSLFSIWYAPYCALQLLRIMLRARPNIVISTGAAPGLLAMGLGRLIGAKTVWVESITNFRTVSLSGRLAVRLAAVWIAQWDLPSIKQKPCYLGGVI